MRDAFDDPVPPGVGQPGRKRERAEPVVKRLVAFREAHADGAPHFHVAILLGRKSRWGAAKRTLREKYSIAAHFSCSHTQFWSAVHYGLYPSPKKPVVDATPYMWASDQTWPTGAAPAGSPGRSALFEAAQRPWQAGAWKGRSEAAHIDAAAGTGKAPRITKLDVTAVIVEKQITTPSALMAYVQDSGSTPMQAWVNNNQSKLKAIIAEAHEWARARQTAHLEKETDWEVVLRRAAEPCPHGDRCGYACAAEARRALKNPPPI